MRQRIYKYIFWTGYFAVLLTTFIPIAGELNKTTIGPEAFHIRLDHLLHLLVYFIICMYYLFGSINVLTLFDKRPLIKFILLITILGIFTEAVQLYIPERAFNVFDLLSNLAGIAIGVGTIKILKREKAFRLGKVES